MIGGGLGSQGRWNQYMSLNTSNTAIDQPTAVWMDDFAGVGVNTFNWATNHTGGTAVINPSASGFGQLKLNTGAVINQIASLWWSTFLSFTLGSTKKAEFESGVTISSQSQVTYRVGTYKDANDYFYVEFDPTVRGNNNWWICRNKTGAGETAYDTGSDATVGTWHFFKFVNTSSGVVDVYYKSGFYTNPLTAYTLILSAATNVPTTTQVPYLYVKTLDVNSKSLYVDFVKLSQLRS